MFRMVVREVVVISLMISSSYSSVTATMDTVCRDCASQHSHLRRFGAGFIPTGTTNSAHYHGKRQSGQNVGGLEWKKGAVSARRGTTTSCWPTSRTTCSRGAFHYGNGLNKNMRRRNNQNMVLDPNNLMEPHSYYDGVLSDQDVGFGTVIALALAFLFSYLQGNGSSWSNAVLWVDPKTKMKTDGQLETYKDNEEEYLNYGGSADNNSTTVFDGDSWKEMSRPENYVLYNTRVRQRQQAPQKSSSSSDPKVSPSAAPWALLLLFVPIFSVEFFFALSRQFMCDPNNVAISELSKQLCAPHS
eukprot:scaffold86070_cov43-Attheya_sp.AAC.3